jgi:CubicO group peptidase (beta-lactamase class C family)
MRFHLPLLAALALPCLAQDAARIDQVVQSYAADRQFMGSVLVARGTQVVFSKGYGSANLEWDVPNAPNTKFRLGSITKQFTAASILLLEERGKLSIDDPVKKHMPDAPAAWDKVTILHLLTHTSGIPSFTGFADYRKLQAFATTPPELVARFRDKPLEFQPGEKWAYNNSAYVLLTYLIEKITGDTYEKFVRENIFSPLGMNDSGYDSNTAIIPRRASGYTPGAKGIENAGFVHMSIPQGAGALYSTTEDLLKWELGLFGGKVLKPASLAKMTTPFKNDYAYGLEIKPVGPHKVVQHGGGIEGFNTLLAYCPDDKLTVAVLGNLNGNAPDQIGAKLVALAHGEQVKLPSERKEITLDPEVSGHYVGAYEMAAGGTLLVTLEGSQLNAKLTGQGSLPIFPESESRFFYKAVDAQLDFNKPDAQGRTAEVILHQNGRDRTGKRLADAEYDRLTAAEAAFAKRFKDQTAAPGGETVLRSMIEEIRTGKPDYTRMSTVLAEATRQQLPQLQAAIVQLGAIQSIQFKGVGPGGADIYAVKFANGTVEYRIWLAPDGKVESANMRPAN